MAHLRRRGVFAEVAIRAMSDSLYERLIDRCWAELKVVFERPDVQRAEAVIMKAIAEAFSPNGHTKRSRKR
jgi:hypothetical protein